MSATTALWFKAILGLTFCCLYCTHGHKERKSIRLMNDLFAYIERVLCDYIWEFGGMNCEVMNSCTEFLNSPSDLWDHEISLKMCHFSFWPGKIEFLLFLSLIPLNDVQDFFSSASFSKKKPSVFEFRWEDSSLKPRAVWWWLTNMGSPSDTVLAGWAVTPPFLLLGVEWRSSAIRQEFRESLLLIGIDAILRH